MTLADKIVEIEAFERTPGGGALVKYRSAITVAVMTDEDGCDAKRQRCWAAVREAESALMGEIKALQHDIERHVGIANEIADKNEAMILALGMIAGKNDLSGVHDCDIESVARGALHECELIAREALGEYDGAASEELDAQS